MGYGSCFSVMLLYSTLIIDLFHAFYQLFHYLYYQIEFYIRIINIFSAEIILINLDTKDTITYLKIVEGHIKILKFKSCKYSAENFRYTGCPKLSWPVKIMT